MKNLTYKIPLQIIKLYKYRISILKYICIFLIIAINFCLINYSLINWAAIYSENFNLIVTILPIISVVIITLLVNQTRHLINKYIGIANLLVIASIFCAIFIFIFDQTLNRNAFRDTFVATSKVNCSTWMSIMDNDDPIITDEFITDIYHENWYLIFKTFSTKKNIETLRQEGVDGNFMFSILDMEQRLRTANKYIRIHEQIHLSTTNMDPDIIYANLKNTINTTTTKILLCNFN